MDHKYNDRLTFKSENDTDLHTKVVSYKKEVSKQYLYCYITQQVLKLHEEAQVEINDYGNDLSDIETFAKHLRIELSIIDAELNSLIASSTQQTKVPKTRSTC